MGAIYRGGAGFALCSPIYCIGIMGSCLWGRMGGLLGAELSTIVYVLCGISHIIHYNSIDTCYTVCYTVVSKLFNSTAYSTFTIYHSPASLNRIGDAMSAQHYTVIDSNTGIVIRMKALGKSPSEVLKRYLAKEWIQRNGLTQLEVMTTEEYKLSGR